MCIDNKFKNKKNFLNHVAIIMDGNGRWAKKNGKSRLYGHKKGLKAVYNAIQFSLLNKIKILTLYAFSSENWNRPIVEILSLMHLLNIALENDFFNLKKYNIRLKIIGNITYLHPILQNKIEYIEKLTLHNSGLILNIAINYGGRWDITEAVKKLIHHVKSGVLNINDIQENNISNLLCTHNLDPVDLVIRTGGEYRISNFLIWQIAYSEFYFTKICWPDFNDNTFSKAINVYLQRNRRFGCIK
ncbi:MAG TPA: polyprenyl diphosphate synthase [Buchnera sp. (in: enterobacteria)]|nr:polyprenyl diphosphate synthase [Buchnera sp. (in: enterobacteria)]